MRMRPTRMALLATLICAFVPATRLDAQLADSASRWSLFGGSVLTRNFGGGQLLPKNLEIGGSGDFRAGSFPLPLRVGLSFNRVEQELTGNDLKYGTLTLDAVGRPLPRILGTQLYFLGGLGVATRAGYFLVPGNTTIPYEQWLVARDSYNHPRQNWAFLEGGMGLDVGRAFIQFKLQSPVASDGPSRAPISVGFRF